MNTLALIINIEDSEYNNEVAKLEEYLKSRKDINITGSINDLLFEYNLSDGVNYNSSIEVYTLKEIEKIINENESYFHCRYIYFIIEKLNKNEYKKKK